MNVFSARFNDSFSNEKFNSEQGKLQLEIVPWEAQLYCGAYMNNKNDTTGKFFNGISYVVSFSLPIILGADYKENYSNYDNNFGINRILWIRPVISVGLTNRSSSFFAFGNKIVFPIANVFNVSYNLSMSWVEGSLYNFDGLVSGLNFFHVFSIEKRISKKIKLSLSTQHLSNGKLLKGEGSNHTSFVFSMGYKFKRIKNKNF